MRLLARDAGGSDDGVVSVTVAVVDPASEADAPLGLGSKPRVVEDLVDEGAVEPHCLAVSLGPGAAVQDRRSASTSANASEQKLGPLSVRTSSTAMSLDQSWALRQNPTGVVAVSLSWAST